MAWNDKWVHEGGRNIRVDRYRKQKGWGKAAAGIVLGLLVLGALSGGGSKNKEAARDSNLRPATDMRR